jgi:hypothetical protein
MAFYRVWAFLRLFVKCFLKSFRGRLRFAAEHDWIFVGATIGAMNRKFDWFASQPEAVKGEFAANLIKAVRTLRASRCVEIVN